MKNSAHSRLSSLPRDLSECESGNALIELAASLPLYLVLILGTAEIANLAWSSVQVNNAARAGAAYASLSRANAANNANILLAAQAEAPNLAITFPSGPTPLCYCVDSGGTSTATTCDQSGVSGCNAPSTFQVAIQVNVQAMVTPFVHYPGLPATYTVNAQATMGVTQ
jgi:Flp pilus assembly protein TadG